MSEKKPYGVGATVCTKTGCFPLDTPKKVKELEKEEAGGGYSVKAVPGEKDTFEIKPGPVRSTR